MSNLGPKKIGSNYQRLLQTNDNGMVADGTGSLISLRISGSEYYDSGSGVVDILKALTVTGSIIPEGSGSWDLGSEDNPFRDLYITSASIRLVDPAGLARVKKLGGDHLKVSRSLYVSEFNKDVLDTILKGEVVKSVDTTTGKKLDIKERPDIVSKFTKVHIKSSLEVNGSITGSYFIGDGSALTNIIPVDIIRSGIEPFVWDSSHNLVSNNLTNRHIVSDRFWLWNSDDNELEPRSIMFGYADHDSPSNDLVIGG